MFNNLDEVRDYLNCEKIECLECGKKFKKLNQNHLLNHAISVREYKIKYGIPVTWGLLSEPCRERAKEAANNLNNLDRLREIAPIGNAENIRKNKGTLNNHLSPLYVKELQERLDEVQEKRLLLYRSMRSVNP